MSIEIRANCAKIIADTEKTIKNLTESLKYILDPNEKDKIENDIMEIRDAFYGEAESYIELLNNKDVKKDIENITSPDDEKYRYLLQAQNTTVKDLMNIADHLEGSKIFLKDAQEAYENHHRSKGDKQEINNAVQGMHKIIRENCEKIIKSLKNIENDLEKSVKYISNEEKREKVLNELGEIKKDFLSYSELYSSLSKEDFKEIKGVDDRRYEELLNLERQTNKDVRRFAEYEKSAQESLQNFRKIEENAQKSKENSRQNSTSTGSSGYSSGSFRSSSDSSERGSGEQKPKKGFAVNESQIQRSEISPNPKTQSGGNSGSTVQDLIKQFGGGRQKPGGKLSGSVVDNLNPNSKKKT